MIKEDPFRPTLRDLKAAATNAKDYIKRTDGLFADAIGRKSAQGIGIVEADEFIRVAEERPFHDGMDGQIARLWAQLSELAHGAAVPVHHRMLHHTARGHVRASHPDVSDLAKAAGIVTHVLDAALELFYLRLGWQGNEQDAG